MHEPLMQSGGVRVKVAVIPLTSAMLCARCRSVVEALASGRCAMCGCKTGLIPLERALVTANTGEQTLRESHAELRVRAVEEALQRHRNNYTETAAALGIHRNTVRRIAGAKRVNPLLPQFRTVPVPQNARRNAAIAGGKR